MEPNINLKQEMASNQVVLIVLDSLNYKDETINLLKNFSGEKIMYVVIDKPFNSVDEDFKKNGIDTNNIFYINVTREEIKKEDARSYHLNSTSALTELSIIINKMLRGGYTYLIFDSITNLLIHNDGSKTKRFLLDLTQKIRRTPTKGIYYALDSDVTKNLIENINPTIDKTIKRKAAV